MESVFRVLIIYFFLLVIIRLSGKKTLAESSPFDMVVLLIIGDLVQEAIMDDDYSIMNCIVVVTTLMLLEVTISFIKQVSQKAEKLIDGVPLILINNGEVLKERMKKSRIREEDILESARTTHGLERIDQIKYAVLEKSGQISVIEKK